ncbi:MAG: hypothetical protein U9N87_03615 [Planctomycetota bacterium]|nr:hypothetical protein [Planctomycetota bacterium]
MRKWIMLAFAVGQFAMSINYSRADSLQFDKPAAAFKLQLGWCRIARWQIALEADGKILRPVDAKVEVLGENQPHVKLHFAKQKLDWEIKTRFNADTKTVLMDSTIHNCSDKPVALGKAWLMDTDGVQGFSDGGDADGGGAAVCLPHLVKPVGQVMQRVCNMGPKHPPASHIKLQMFNQDRARALQAGFVTFQRLKTQVLQKFEPQKGLLQLKAWCEFAGWKLEPGAGTNTERFILAVGDNPHTQLERWADLAAASCSPPPRRWQEAPIGWLGWTWVDPYDANGKDTYESVVFRNAKAIRKRLAGFGVDYIWISIGNLPDGQPGDWLGWNAKRFPSGREHLNEHLTRLGFKWGFWCGPFYLSTQLKDKVAQYKDALLKKPDGKDPMVVLGSWTYGLDDQHSKGNPLYGLDPTHPDTLRYLDHVFKTYRSWGVRYYMVDFLYIGSGNIGPFGDVKKYDPHIVLGPEALQNALKVIRRAAGDDTYLLASTSPTIHCAGLVDGMRTGNDFGEGRPRHHSRPNYPATTFINTSAGSHGPVHALCNQASAYYTHRKLYINDSGNVLSVDTPFPLNEARIYATIHAMSGGSTMLGDDISMIDDSRLKLIKQTLPRPKQVAFPVDLFAKRDGPCPKIFHRKITKPWGRFDVVAVYNFDLHKPLTRKIDLAQLGLDPKAGYHVWRFWDNEYSGKATGSMTANVGPRGVELYRLTKDDGRPVVIGTDMHLLMGEMEINSRRWDAAKKIFSGKALRPAGERGNVYVYVPEKLGVKYPSKFVFGKDSRYRCLIMRVPLEFDGKPASWNIEFFDH